MDSLRSVQGLQLLREGAPHATQGHQLPQPALDDEPEEYGGKTSVAECITSWKRELEAGREELLELDQLKVDSSAPVGEQLALVRKKSRHDSGSGSEVLSMMGNMRKHEAEP